MPEEIKKLKLSYLFEEPGENLPGRGIGGLFYIAWQDNEQGELFNIIEFEVKKLENFLNTIEIDVSYIMTISKSRNIYSIYPINALDVVEMFTSSVDFDEEIVFVGKGT